MMTAQERVASLHERMEALQRTKERQKTTALGSLCYVMTICLLMLVFSGTSHTVGTAGLYSGAVLMFENAGGYVLTAVVAFVIGVIVTAAIIWNREKTRACLMPQNVKSQNAEIAQKGNEDPRGGEER